jgi:hypothetical protein
MDNRVLDEYFPYVSEFGLSGKYFIIHARRPQFHFSTRVPGLAGQLAMPSVDTLSGN